MMGPILTKSLTPIFVARLLIFKVTKSLEKYYGKNVVEPDFVARVVDVTPP